MMLMMVELVDVKDDLVWSLRQNRRNDEMAIIEEGENHFVMAAYSNRLCDDAIQIKVRLSSVFAKKKKSTIFTWMMPITTGRPIRRYSALSYQGNRRLFHVCYSPEKGVMKAPDKGHPRWLKGGVVDQ
jgi:hypothetical protein